MKDSLEDIVKIANKIAITKVYEENEIKILQEWVNNTRKEFEDFISESKDERLKTTAIFALTLCNIEKTLSLIETLELESKVKNTISNEDLRNLTSLQGFIAEA